MVVRDVVNLGSSSRGNAYFLNINRKGYSKSFGLLIECGFEYSEIAYRLRKLSDGKFSINDVDVVLITHRHHDHAKAIVDMLKMNKRVYAPKQVYDEFGINLNNYKNNAFVLKHSVRKAIADGIIVSPLAMKHDEFENYIKSQQRKGQPLEIVGEPTLIENLAYIITINNNYNILFMIDTMYNPYNLSKYKFDMIFIETNYFSQPIWIAYRNATENRDYGNRHRYMRLLYSHLSVENATKTLNGFDLSKTQSIFAMHTSTTERAIGDAARFYLTIKTKLKPTKARLLVCLKEGGFHTGSI